MIRWAGLRVLVTGGAGFLGAPLVDTLRARGCRDITIPRSREYDLRESDAIVRLYEAARPQVVIHLAATVGGIGANRGNPGRFFYDNAIMGIQLMEHARRRGVEKFVALGTVCAYPKFTPVPFKEDALWNGYPEETNAPYGLAKKMLLVQGQAYRAQYGFNAIFLLPVNLYGPRDNFDLESSHVIPAMIRKFLAAKEQGAATVVLWGDGSPTREFLHVEDAAEAIALATERYDGPEPVNLGSGQEISIRELAELISSEVGFRGDIAWDTSQPNGQPRRRLDVSRAESLFGFRARRSFHDGVRQTIDWFLEHRAELASTELSTEGRRE
jgi:GDP-L-fucose synthase